MPAPWVWDASDKRYRNTETGRYIGVRQLIPMRDTYIEAQKNEIDDLNTRLFDKRIDTAQWTDEFKEILRTTYKDEYALGIGGMNNMTQADYGRVGGVIRGQYNYLYKFADQIENGQLSIGQIRARSRMYIDSATQMYERARAVAWDIKLPAYPGDGQTMCKSNCKCGWHIEDKPTTIDAYWKLGIAEHCDDCVDNSERWNPYQIAKAI